MYKQIFVFGTPAGGADDIKFIFEKNGFISRGVLDKPDSTLELLSNVSPDAFPLDSFPELMLFGSQFADDEIVVHYDTFMSAKLGASETFFQFLIKKFPDAKFVFAFMENSSNLARLLATNRTWIPAYADCSAKCEFRMKVQISEFKDFIANHPDKSMAFNAKSGDWGALIKFVTE